MQVGTANYGIRDHAGRSHLRAKELGKVVKAFESSCRKEQNPAKAAYSRDRK